MYINSKIKEIIIVNFVIRDRKRSELSTEGTETHRYQSYRQLASVRRQSARIAENVDTVNDLLLSDKGALKCIKPRVKLQGRPRFITRQCTAIFN